MFAKVAISGSVCLQHARLGVSFRAAQATSKVFRRQRANRSSGELIVRPHRVWLYNLAIRLEFCASRSSREHEVNEDGSE